MKTEPAKRALAMADRQVVMEGFSAIIHGSGAAVPERRLTNDDLSKMVDTNDEWITQRTGIHERRIASESETTASLAAAAARRALEASGLRPGDIDLVLVTTITPEMVFPSTACYVAADLGVPAGVPAFDLSAACSGFVYGLTTATAMIRCGQYKNILLIGAETLSKVTDYTDRASCVLFGDGAGAIVLGRGPKVNGAGGKQRGVIYTSLGADGGGVDVMRCAPGSRTPISAKIVEDRQHFIQLRGREVYKFAVTMFGNLIQDAMRVCELKPADVTLIVPHQVNRRIIDSAMEKIHLPLEMAYMNIDKYGNTSSASIPMALDEAIRVGRIKQGQIAIFVAFGAGLTWGSAVVRL